MGCDPNSGEFGYDRNTRPVAEVARLWALLGAGFPIRSDPSSGEFGYGTLGIRVLANSIDKCKLIGIKQGAAQARQAIFFGELS